MKFRHHDVFRIHKKQNFLFVRLLFHAFSVFVSRIFSTFCHVIHSVIWPNTKNLNASFFNTIFYNIYIWRQLIVTCFVVTAEKNRQLFVHPVKYGRGNEVVSGVWK